MMGRKRKKQSGNTFFDKLNFDDMSSQRRVEEIQTNILTQVLETEHLVPETSPEDADEIIKKMKETKRADPGDEEEGDVQRGAREKLRAIDRELRERESFLMREG